VRLSRCEQTSGAADSFLLSSFVFRLSKFPSFHLPRSTPHASISHVYLHTFSLADSQAALEAHSTARRRRLAPPHVANVRRAQLRHALQRGCVQAGAEKVRAVFRVLASRHRRRGRRIGFLHGFCRRRFHSRIDAILDVTFAPTACF
jgi:hypothetical protein